MMREADTHRPLRIELRRDHEQRAREASRPRAPRTRRPLRRRLPPRRPRLAPAATSARRGYRSPKVLRGQLTRIGGVGSKELIANRRENVRIGQQTGSSVFLGITALWKGTSNLKHLRHYHLARVPRSPRRGALDRSRVNEDDPSKIEPPVCLAAPGVRERRCCDLSQNDCRQARTGAQDATQPAPAVAASPRSAQARVPCGWDLLALHRSAATVAG